MSVPAPAVRLGRGDCGRFESAVRKEWLVTNGLGGFASGTVAGLNTRRYHGLLVAALRPPQQRTLAVAKIDTRACYDETAYPLFTNEFGAGTVDPHGYRCIESFHLDHLIPVWTWALADARLEQRIWMDHGHNTVRLSFTLARASGPVSLTATPLVTWRDFHSHTRDGGEVGTDPISGGVAVHAGAGAPPCRIVGDRGAFRPHPEWYWDFRYRMEAERGLDAAEDLFSPGSFTCALRPGEAVTFSCSLEDVAADGGRESLERERARQAELLRALPAEEPAWVRHLALAADQFVVRRSLPDGADPNGTAAGRTVIGPAERDAGYHQGTVWGWLLGPFATAHYRVYRDPAATRGILAPLKDHLADAGLGSISEVFDGDPPHLPGGCVAQAWSVAEVLRAWRQLPAAGPPAAGRAGK